MSKSYKYETPALTLSESSSTQKCFFFRFSKLPRMALMILGDIPITRWFLSQILCDLLSPGDENVKVGLRETTQNTLTHLRSKTLVADTQAQPQRPVQRQHLHQVRAASAHHLENQEVLTQWSSIAEFNNEFVNNGSCSHTSERTTIIFLTSVLCHCVETLGKCGATWFEPSSFATIA